VSVVIGSFNRRSYLKDTLATVRSELDGVAHEILVVDGGSGDGSIDWLVKQKDVITIVQHNRGEWLGGQGQQKSWGYFMNLAFKAAHGRYVCMLSDDCLVVPDAIRNGLALFDRELSAGRKLGAVAFYFRDWPGDPHYRIGRVWGNRMFVNHGLYLREALETVGYIREEPYRFYHADGDLALRLAEAGYPCVDSPDSYIEHYLHANTAVRDTNVAIERRDWEAYAAEWGWLGAVTELWVKRDYIDPHHTAEKYWYRKDWARRHLRPALHAVRRRAALACR
jgi:GT2 family glycosyltransferase